MGFKLDNRYKDNNTAFLVYVPTGKTEKYKLLYSLSNDYLTKLVFIEDTHEIYVNGMSFGYNYDNKFEEVWSSINKITEESIPAIYSAILEHTDTLNNRLTEHDNAISAKHDNLESSFNKQIADLLLKLTNTNENINDAKTLLTSLLGSLTQLTNEVSSLKVDLKALETKYNFTKTTVDSHAGSVSSLLSRVATLENNAK